MTIAVRQEAAQQGVTSGTGITSPAFSGSCLVGSTIEVWVAAGGASVPSSVTDSASQTYTMLQSGHDGFDGQELSLWVCQNNQSATKLTVTATFSSSASNAGVWAKEITGVQASSVQASVIAYVPTPGTATKAISSGAITAGGLLSSLCFGGVATMVVDTAATAGTTGFVQSAQSYGLSESYVGSNTTAFYTDSTGGASGHYLVGAVTYIASTGLAIVNSSGLQSFSNTAGPVSYTTGWSVTSGNTLLLLYSNVDNNNNGTGIASVADGQGSYTQDAHYNGFGHFDQGSFSLANAASGAHVIVLTMNASAAAYGSFVVVELSGAWTFDATLGSATGASTTPSVTGSAPAGDDFQIAIYCGSTSNNEPQTPSGWSGSYMGIPASGWPSAGYVWQQSSSAAGATSFGTLAASDTWGALIVGYSPQAGPGTTLTASAGSFALTGFAATLIETQPASLTLLANPGAFDLFGAQAQSQLQLYALTTSYVLTGNNAILTQGSNLITMVAGTGSFALTGQNAALQAGNYIFPAFTGSFTLTGETANLLFSGAAPAGFEFLPNYVGLTWLDASRFLFMGGFVEVAPVVVKPKGKQAAGIVLSQQPAANTLVPLGTSVQFTVSNGSLLAASFETVAGEST